MQMSRIGRTLAGIAAMVFLVAGCNESTATEFDLTVTNNPDNFVAQSVTVLNESLDREYTWQNSGTRANVTHATIAENGVARIVIRDAANVIVYDKSLTSTLVEATQVGVAGSWRIEILLSGFSGSVNVRVQKL